MEYTKKPRGDTAKEANSMMLLRGGSTQGGSWQRWGREVGVGGGGGQKAAGLKHAFNSHIAEYRLLKNSSTTPARSIAHAKPRLPLRESMMIPWIQHDQQEFINPVPIVGAESAGQPLLVG